MLRQRSPRQMAIVSWCACLTFTLASPIGLWAQDATATVSGTVTDSSGAVISDATIQAKNTASGQNRSTTSDSQGRFRLPDLSIGDYEIQATKAGFQTTIRRGVTLTVGSQLVADFSMPIGQAQRVITIEGQVSSVETESTAVGALVEQTQMRELPLNGRNFGQLITLAPGAVATPAGTSFYGKTQNYSISGSRPEGTAFLLDRLISNSGQ